MNRLQTILALLLTTILIYASNTVFCFNDSLTTYSIEVQRNTSFAPIQTIVIDPGHGGHDHGCSGAHSKEKHLALELALKFGQLIEDNNPNFKVIYTRETDVFIPLHKRAAIANKAAADLFVSIHCNAIANASNIHGSETYVMGLHTADHNLRVAKRENEAMHLEKNVNKNYSFDPNSPEGHITLSMFQHAFLEKSLELAYDIEQSLATREGRQSRGVLQAGFMVLKETAMPSILVESGYLTNKEEEEYLTSAQGLDETAIALYDGFMNYMRRNEKTPQKQKQFVSRVSKSKIKKENRFTKIKKSNKIDFYVQLAASPTLIKIKAQPWSFLDKSVRYIKEGNLYKYQAGPFPSKIKADEVRTQVLESGVKGAFVTGYKNGKKVSSNQLK